MAKDIIHDAVKNALIKDGWTITDDPYRIEYEEFTLFADLAAERLLPGEQTEWKVVIEIKSFIGRSFVENLHKAVGQYTIYRNLLARTSPKYQLYLALGEDIYDEFFGQKAVQMIIKENHLALIIVNTEQEEVVKWMS